MKLHQTLPWFWATNPRTISDALSMWPDKFHQTNRPLSSYLQDVLLCISTVGAWTFFRDIQLSICCWSLKINLITPTACHLLQTHTKLKDYLSILYHSRKSTDGESQLRSSYRKPSICGMEFAIHHLSTALTSFSRKKRPVFEAYWRNLFKRLHFLTWKSANSERNH